MIVKEDNHNEDINLLLAKLDSRMGKLGVVHVGAHVGEEVDAYLKEGFRKVILIEANPRCCKAMEEQFRHVPHVQIFNCAISDHDGRANLHIHTSRSGSTEPASLLKLKRFKEIVKTLTTSTSVEVECLTLDSFFTKHNVDLGEFDLLNLDIQGAELKALQGAMISVKSFKAVITEVNLIELYQDAPLEKEICEFLEKRGFQKLHEIYHDLYDEESTFPAWGECLFIKRELNL